jgi:hypothetical protein
MVLQSLRDVFANQSDDHPSQRVAFRAGAFFKLPPQCRVDSAQHV